MKTRSKFQRSLIALLHRAPLPLFVITRMLAAFLGGVYVSIKKVFPYDLLRDAHRAGETLYALYKEHEEGKPWLLRSADISPDSLEAFLNLFFFVFSLEQPMDHNDMYKGLAIVG